MSVRSHGSSLRGRASWTRVVARVGWIGWGCEVVDVEVLAGAAGRGGPVRARVITQWPLIGCPARTPSPPSSASEVETTPLSDICTLCSIVFSLAFVQDDIRSHFAMFPRNPTRRPDRNPELKEKSEATCFAPPASSLCFHTITTLFAKSDTPTSTVKPHPTVR
jgi:hypothetical protein